MGDVVAHGLAGPPGSALDAFLTSATGQVPGTYRALVGPSPFLVADVTAPAEVLATAARGLPAGPAQAEAVVARLRAAGQTVTWGRPVTVATTADLLARERRRGASSLDVWRAEPGLLPLLTLGGWFGAALKARTLRRALLAGGAPVGALLARTGRVPALRAAASAAFWRGARARATDQEWRRLTASSYVAFCYHRLAGQMRPGEEYMDLPPAQFAGQLRLLRALRFTLLGLDDVLAFHAGERATLPPRSVLVAVDDAFADAVGRLHEHVAARPAVFVPTRRVGGPATWLDGPAAPGWALGGDPIADWDALRALEAAGVPMASHTRLHRRLPDLDDAALDDELTGSLADLRAELAAPLAALAYPEGRYDDRVRRRAIAAGYALGFATTRGVNGAGTDPWSLHRTAPVAADTRLAFLWRAVTGDQLPPTYRRWVGATRSALRPQ